MTGRHSVLTLWEKKVAIQEKEGLVTLAGNPVVLLGPELKAGDEAPDFKVVDESFTPVKLSDFAGKKVLISAVPSLDTPVCSLQTKRFNEEAAKLGEDVAVLTISADLPFAQKRFCEAEKIGETKVLSDSVWKDFGQEYGVLIKDMGLLARSIFIVGKEGKLEYVELVKEVTSHPDYDRALAELKKLD